MKLLKRTKDKSGALNPVERETTPFWPMRRLQGEIDRLFEEPFGSWWNPSGALTEDWAPAVDVYEDKDNVVVKAELPGMKKEELEVYMTGDNLNLAGERRTESEEKSGHTYRAERYFGRFHRSIPLPFAVDATRIEAHYKDGILRIVCPKSEESKRIQIEVKID